MGDSSQQSLAHMFLDFVNFYLAWLDKDSSARAPESESTTDIFIVEDPYDPQSSASTSLTVDGATRLKKEFERAAALLVTTGNGEDTRVSCSLSQLLERWCP